MNERIKELIAESTWVQFAEGVGYKEVFDKEKFAKLIINECLDWCNAHAMIDGTAQRIAESIRKEFGVEK